MAIQQWEDYQRSQGSEQYWKRTTVLYQGQEEDFRGVHISAKKTEKDFQDTVCWTVPENSGLPENSQTMALQRQRHQVNPVQNNSPSHSYGE